MTDKGSVHASHASQADDEGDDGSLLQFGASVAFHDELRRRVTADTAEMDKATAKLLEEVSLERKIYQQTIQDRWHAQSEMKAHAQTAQESLDRLQMNHQVQNELLATLRREFHSNKKDSNTAVPCQQAEHPQNVVPENSENARSTPRWLERLIPSSEATNFDFLPMTVSASVLTQMMKELETIGAEIKENQAIALATDAKVHDQVKVQVANDEEKLAQAQEASRQKRSILQDKQLQVESLQYTVSEQKKRIEENRTLLRKAREASLQNEKSRATELLNAKNRLTQSQAEKDRLQKLLHAKEVVESKEVDDEFASIKQSQDALNEYWAKKQAIAQKRDALRVERQNLHALQNEIQDKIVAAQHTLDRAKREENQTMRDLESSQNRKIKNDQMEAEKIVQARVELEELRQENTNAKDTLSKLSDLGSQEAAFEAEFQKEESRIKELQSKIEAAQKDVEAKSSKLEAAQRSHEKLVGERKVEQDRLQAILGSKTAELQKYKLAQEEKFRRRAQKQRQLDELQRTLDVFQRGVKIINDSKQTQLELSQLKLPMRD